MALCNLLLSKPWIDKMIQCGPGSVDKINKGTLYSDKPDL